MVGGEGRKVLKEIGSQEASWEAEVLILAKDEGLCWDGARVGREEEEGFENKWGSGWRERCWKQVVTPIRAVP